MRMLVFEGVDVVERFVMVGQREVFDGLCEGGRLWASKGLSVWRRGLCAATTTWSTCSV